MEQGKRFLIIILFGGLLFPVSCSALETPVPARRDEWLENLRGYQGYILGSFALATLAILGRYLYRKALERESKQPRGASVIKGLYPERKVPAEERPQQAPTVAQEPPRAADVAPQVSEPPVARSVPVPPATEVTLPIEVSEERGAVLPVTHPESLSIMSILTSISPIDNPILIKSHLLDTIRLPQGDVYKLTYILSRDPKDKSEEEYIVVTHNQKALFSFVLTPSIFGLDISRLQGKLFFTYSPPEQKSFSQIFYVLLILPTNEGKRWVFLARYQRLREGAPFEEKAGEFMGYAENLTEGTVREFFKDRFDIHTRPSVEIQNYILSDLVEMRIIEPLLIPVEEETPR